jgi:hypothetical protein
MIPSAAPIHVTTNLCVFFPTLNVSNAFSYFCYNLYPGVDFEAVVQMSGARERNSVLVQNRMNMSLHVPLARKNDGRLETRFS